LREAQTFKGRPGDVALGRSGAPFEKGAQGCQRLGTGTLSEPIDNSIDLLGGDIGQLRGL